MSDKKTAPIAWLPVALIVALSGINLLLIRQNFNLRRQLSEPTRTNASANALKSGETVTAISGTDLNGRQYQVEYG